MQLVYGTLISVLQIYVLGFVDDVNALQVYELEQVDVFLGIVFSGVGIQFFRLADEVGRIILITLPSVDKLFVGFEIGRAHV